MVGTWDATPYGHVEIERIFRGMQGMHKRLIWFEKLIKKLFLTLHGHNIHCQQQKMSKFRMRYSSSLIMLTAGQWDQFPRLLPAGEGFLYAPF
jgi:hypothetical protein